MFQKMSATFSVIINADFGGLMLSDSVMKAYNSLPDVEQITSPYDFDRTDTRLAYLIEKSPQMSNLVVENIPVKYRNHYWIDEYDGAEAVKINFAQYQVAMIKEIIDGPDDDKLDRIKAFLENSPEEKLEDEFNNMN